MKVKLLLTAITLSCLAIDVLAQVSISGKIVSADTNEPVVGANIRIDQSLSGCTTNGKGEFNINNLPDGKHVLRITHVSYTPKSVTTKGVKKSSYQATRQFYQYRPGSSNRYRNTPPHDGQSRACFRYHRKGFK